LQTVAFNSSYTYMLFNLSQVPSGTS